MEQQNIQITDIDDTGHYHQTRKWNNYYHSTEAYRYSHPDEASEASFSGRRPVIRRCDGKSMVTGFTHERLPSLDDYDRR